MVFQDIVHWFFYSNLRLAVSEERCRRAAGRWPIEKTRDSAATSRHHGQESDRRTQGGTQRGQTQVNSEWNQKKNKILQIRSCWDGAVPRLHESIQRARLYRSSQIYSGMLVFGFLYFWNSEHHYFEKYLYIFIFAKNFKQKFQAHLKAFVSAGEIDIDIGSLVWRLEPVERVADCEWVGSGQNGKSDICSQQRAEGLAADYFDGKIMIFWEVTKRKK